MGLRLLVHDAVGRDALRMAWRTGAPVYRALGRIDASYGARTWAEALLWLGSVRTREPIDEIQYWGHGKWGCALVGDDVLDARALQPDHAWEPLLRAIRVRLSGPDALWWFRTCETFGADAGSAFAVAWSRYFGCAVAGHTYVIGAWQSGLHLLRAGAAPDWAPSEGLAAGTPAAPIDALASTRAAPSTIHFLTGRPT